MVDDFSCDITLEWIAWDPIGEVNSLAPGRFE